MSQDSEMSNMKNIFLRPPRMQRRVVVTGVEAITPLGVTLEQSWENALEARSGIGLIEQFDASEYEVKIAGEAKSFNADEFVPKKEQRRMDRFCLFSLAAAHSAVKKSGLSINSDSSHRIGSLVGVGMGGLPYIEQQMGVLKDKGPSRMSPFFIPIAISNMAPGHISMALGIKGLNYAITSACASGAHAIGEAYRYVRDGYCDAMVTGGAESTVCGSAIGGFSAMKALSTRNEQPQSASRPFDRDRDGFVLAEGAAILILEDYETASRRGAPILAEIRGYGASSDAYHMTSPAPEGGGAALAMANALEDAGLNPSDIDYINAHGTSTPVGDEIETQAIKRVFKDHAKKIWVSSTKSMTGHTLGAAGAIESAFCLAAMKSGVVPPTINLDNPSDGCDLDYVPHVARERRLKHVLNNSFGFGGTNACLIFSAIGEE